MERYQENSIQIWTQIYKELLHSNNDSELESVCLDTLSAYIAKLSTGDETPFKLHVKDVIDTLKGNLLPDAKLFEITSKVLLQITNATQAAADLTRKEILPILTNTYNITKTSTHQVKLLKVLVSFAKILNDVFGGNVEEQEQICILTVAALTHNDVELKITAWKSIEVIELPESLKQCVFVNMKNSITQPLEAKLREALLVCFKTLAVKYPDNIKSDVIEKVEINNLVALHFFLEALGRITTYKQFVKTVFPIFMRYCLGSVEEAEIAFACLNMVLEKNSEVVTYLNENEEAIKQIAKWIFQNEIIVEKRKLLESVSGVLKFLVASLGKQSQENLLVAEVDQIIQRNKEKPNVIQVVLLNGLLLRLHPDINVSREISDAVFALAFDSHSLDYINEICVQLFANILNKTKDEGVLCTYLEEVSEKCNAQAKTICWVTKALLMRNHAQTNAWIEKVSRLFQIVLLFEIKKKREKPSCHRQYTEVLFAF